MALPPEDPDRADEVAFFRRSWSVYDALVEWNYMGHREIFDRIGRWLRDHRDRSAGAFLDLGCGNSRLIGRCFRDTPPASYLGVDLSAQALAEAPDHLGWLPGSAWRQAEMVGFLEEGGDSRFDVIFSSFALHHLDRGTKERCLRAAAARLAPGGAFLLVDVKRLGGESRDEAVAAYVRMMREEWRRLDPDHLAEACSHVEAFDFPESEGVLREIGAAAGFGRVEALAAHGRHQVLVYSEPAVGGPALPPA